MKTIMQNLLTLQSLECGQIQDPNIAAMIAELRRQLAPAILLHYDRFRVRGKKGLVAVRNQVCTGCHMRVPIGIIMTIKRQTDIQLCESCGRYLYLPEEEPAAVKVAATVKPSRRRQVKAGPQVGSHS